MLTLGSSSGPMDPTILSIGYWRDLQALHNEYAGDGAITISTHLINLLQITSTCTFDEQSISYERMTS